MEKASPTLINQQEATTMTSTFRIIKKATSPKLSPRAQGSLIYHVGYDETAKTFHFRITARAVEHKIGKGCAHCAGVVALTTEQAIAQLQETHGDLYDYSQVVYQSAHNKVTILCPKYGPFEQMPNAHKYGQGCPSCRDENHVHYHRDHLQALGIAYAMQAAHIPGIVY